MKKKIPLYCVVIATALMATPFGVAMTFAPGPTQGVTKYYSYFSLMPLGYANWFPAIIALLSTAVLVLLLIGHTRGKIRKVVQICLVACIVMSLLSWLVFNSITTMGVFIMGLHAISLLSLQVD